MDNHGIITTTAALQAFVARLAAQPWVAIDTEFMREKTYYPRLCLVQLASAQDLACIDPLALEDLQPLIQVLQDPNVLKVFHAASQDLEALHLSTGQIPQPIFDTQVAASILGLGKQLGYANLVETTLNITLPKTQTRTDWLRRPLSAQQLQYAQDDVRYLAHLYLALSAQLEAKGKSAQMSSAMAQRVEQSRHGIAPERLWRRVAGARRLRANEVAIVRELAIWREAEAQCQNRPRRWIIRDDLLIKMSRSAATRVQEEQALTPKEREGLSLSTEQTTALLDALRRGLEQAHGEGQSEK